MAAVGTVVVVVGVVAAGMEAAEGVEVEAEGVGTVDTALQTGTPTPMPRSSVNYSWEVWHLKPQRIQ